MTITAIFILIGAALLALLVSSVYFSLRDYSLVRLEQLASDRGAMGRVRPILEDAHGHSLAIGFVRVLCHVAVTLSLILAMGVFHADLPEGGGADAAVSGAAGLRELGRDVHLDVWRLVGAFIGASAVIYLFGTVIPMSIAEHAGEKVILAMSPAIRVLHVLAWPIRAVGLIDKGIRQLLGAHHVTEAQEIEEEILSAVTEGEREGSIGETEKEMIESVVELRTLTAGDAMTPRTEIVGLEMTDDLRAIRDFVEASGHSRIPVYMGDLDHIAGMLYAKDLLRYIGAEAGFKLKPVLRPAVSVPVTKPLPELLHELRSRKVHVAIVIDEYGGTTGLLSFEDILEEIVGDIQDEYEPGQEGDPEIKVNLETRSAEVDARAYIEKANEALEPLGVVLPEDGEYDTVGGYVLDVLGRIPLPGESFTTDEYTVTVLEAETTRVTRLRIEAKSPAEAEHPADKSRGAVAQAARADEDGA